MRNRGSGAGDFNTLPIFLASPQHVGNILSNAPPPTVFVCGIKNISNKLKAQSF